MNTTTISPDTLSRRIELMRCDRLGRKLVRPAGHPRLTRKFMAALREATMNKRQIPQRTVSPMAVKKLARTCGHVKSARCYRPAPVLTKMTLRTAQPR